MNELIKLLLENDVEMNISRWTMPDGKAVRVEFSRGIYHKRVLINVYEIEASKAPMETILYSHLHRFLKEVEDKED